jgi:hypothetical protein
VQSNLGPAFGASVDRPHSKSHSRLILWYSCQKRFLPACIAVCAYLMRRFGSLSLWFQNVSKSGPGFFQLISLLLSFPCFKASHFFFKLAYTFQQRRLRRLCGEKFFLQFYDRRVATGSIVDVLQSLREIEGSLKGAEASESLRRGGALASPTRFDAGQRCKTSFAAGLSSAVPPSFRQAAKSGHAQSISLASK